MSKNIVVVSGLPFIRDRLAQANSDGLFDFELFPKQLSFDDVVAAIEQRFGSRVDGVMAIGDMEMLRAAKLREHFGVQHAGMPSSFSIVQCQNKLLSREAQSRSVPEAVPDFWQIDLSDPQAPIGIPEEMTFPVIAKPFFSDFSRLTKKHATRDSLECWLHDNRDRLYAHGSAYTRYVQDIGEGDIPIIGVVCEAVGAGTQVTVDGVMWNGQAVLHGVVDSHFIDDTLSFSHFEYPSQLPQEVWGRMRDVAERFLRSISFLSGPFNVEMFYNHEEDSLMVIEVNSRSASQFHPLYRSLHGTHPILADVYSALGQDPRPVMQHRTQQEGVAAVHILRRDRNARVTHLPTAGEMATFHRDHPGTYLKLLAQEGKTLNVLAQDEQTYRYGDLYFVEQDRSNIPQTASQLAADIPIEFEELV